jgi:hypothetical protein
MALIGSWLVFINQTRHNLSQTRNTF